jgi:hypothetical protein
MKLPNAERAFVDIAKLRDYSLDPVHPEGKHKARVFASALGLSRSDVWLREQLLSVARSQECSMGGKRRFTASGLCWISRWLAAANRHI